VIRLVTQFDDPRSRAAVATPTCGGCCCCCCCCLATTLAASSYIGMSLRSIATRGKPAEERDARLKRASIWAPIVGVIAVGLAAVLALLVGAAVVAVGVLVFFAAWWALLYWCYRAVRAHAAAVRAVVVVVVTSLAFALELAIGGSIVVNAPAAYVVLALVAAVVAIVFEYLHFFRQT
jgi:hypothetical protein